MSLVDSLDVVVVKATIALLLLWLLLATPPAIAMTMRPLVGKILGTRAGGPIVRLIGTTDVHGQGTLHALHDVDPIVLCDIAKIPEANLPKFGAHPHYGVIACSVVTEGSITDSDNLGASDGVPTGAGDIYAAATGRGCRHDEHSLEAARLLQVVVRIPPEKLHLPPSICKAKAASMPKTQQGATVLCGELDGLASPGTPDSWPNCVFLRVYPGDAQNVDLPESYPHGFAVVLAGTGTICGEPVSADDPPAVYLFGKGQTIQLEGDTLDLFIAAGEPIKDTPWVKKLGGNGFGVFRNEQEATDIMQLALDAGDDWSYEVLDRFQAQQSKG